MSGGEYRRQLSEVTRRLWDTFSEQTNMLQHTDCNLTYNNQYNKFRRCVDFYDVYERTKKAVIPPLNAPFCVEFDVYDHKLSNCHKRYVILPLFHRCH